MKHRYTNYMIVIVIVLIIIFLFQSCCRIFANTEQEIFTSPKGTNTIIVEYDFVCRPTIYKKGLFWKEKIWHYSGSGFMETVHFDVEWLSEDQIRFTYDDKDDDYDEEYIITICE